MSKDEETGKRRKAKYFAPTGMDTQPFFPADSLAQLQGSSSPVYITEGEKKGMRLSQEGYATIALPGVYSYKLKGDVELLPELRRIDWTGRTVYIVFDADVKFRSRYNVDMARRRLARLLRTQGAIVWEKSPPTLDAKNGIDDYLVAGGSFLALPENDIPEADPPKSPEYTTGQNELADAERIAERVAGNVHWVQAFARWITWDGKRWAEHTDDSGVKKYAIEQAKLHMQFLGECGNDRPAGLAAFHKSASSNTGMNNRLAILKGLPGILIDHERLDSHAEKLVLANGVFDFADDLFRSHRREDLITKLGSTVYDAAATCEEWLAFVDETFQGDADLIRWVQKCVGYSMLGTAREDLLLVAKGPGGSGKGTFLETVRRMLGQYAATPSPNVIMQGANQRHEVEIVVLRGARFVYIDEPTTGFRVDAETVKRLTGNSPLTGRWMKGNPVEFDPEFTMWWSCNNMPMLSAGCEAIRRRVRIIPFVNQPDPDPTLRECLATSGSLSGILNWAIDGAKLYRAEGLRDVPAAVVDATAAWSRVRATANSDLDRWYAECCTADPAAKTASADLQASVNAYLQPATSETKLGLFLRAKGHQGAQITKGMRKGSKGWTGIALKSSGLDQK